MKNIEMLKDKLVAPDGIHVTVWRKGEIYEAPEDIAKSLLKEEGICKETRKRATKYKKDGGDSGDEQKVGDEASSSGDTGE